MRVKGKRRMIMLAVCAGILAALVIWTAWGNTALELNTYTIASDRLPAAFDGYRIAHVSDLHNAEIGKGNERLLSMLQEARPSMIAMTGDMIDSRRTDIKITLRFAEEAMKIAPCYYVTGNHEARISSYEELRAGLTELGVVVLEDERLEIRRDEQEIVLLGVHDPAFRADAVLDDTAALMHAKLQDLINGEEAYTVLLSHRPELFAVYAACGVDLALGGHAHGGQLRLPLVGGLVAPDQGLFPKYDAGLYTDGITSMLVSRGIGNSIFPFRFHNRPEVILIELRTAR